MSGLKRKLTIIFYADVAGYSRLMGLDEEGSHRQVMAILDSAADTIRESGGEVLRYAGDAILATFSSVAGMEALKNNTFVLHMFLALLLILMIPFSKILHFGGIFFTQQLIRKQ